MAGQISFVYTKNLDFTSILINGEDVSEKFGTINVYGDVIAIAKVRKGDSVSIIFPACDAGDSRAYTERIAWFIN